MPLRCIRPLFVKTGGRNTFIGSNVTFDTIHPEFITISDGVVITNGCVFLTDFINTKGHKFDYGEGYR